MMDFALPDDLRMMAETVRRFAAEELEPAGARVEREGRIPAAIADRMRELGLFGLTIPPEYGGLGLPMVGLCAVMEQLSRANLCFRILVSTNNGIGSLGLLLRGSDGLKQRWLPELAAGRAIGSFALTESEAGSDAAALRTTATSDGDHYLLQGTKIWITNADIADCFTVMATVDRTKGHRGLTAFLVERDTPGLTIGPAEIKMGLHGTAVCEVQLDGVRVPVEHRLGDEGEGFALAMRVLDHGRLSIAASAVGAGQRLLEAMVDHAGGREQFGRPIADNQAIRWMLADTATEIDAARLLVYRAADRKDRGQRATRECSMAKLFATEMGSRVADRAVQVFGGMGYMVDNLAERYFRDLRVYRLYEGTSEIQRLVIAREVLEAGS
jgi:acyl-CoA dehydrogenase